MKVLQGFAVVWLGALAVFAQQAQKPQVLFSGQPPAKAASAARTPSSGVTDAERAAVRITAWDMEVHVAPRQESMEVHARVTLRNDGAAALKEIPLQLSSTLHFEDADLNGQRLSLTQAPLASDADHTGQLDEAAIALPEPLAPQASLTVTVDYGGTIPISAQRLTAIGAPDAAAAASDWDRISEDFTGLRGFGDVVWYPVSSLPEALGDGAKLFAEIGRQKRMDQDATMALRVTDEFTNEPPNAALLDGHFVALNQPASMPAAAFPGVITCSLPSTRLGFETPSLFLARRAETEQSGICVLATEAGAASVQDFLTAALRVQPLVQRWLGNAKRDFTVLDLPEKGDAPAETGDVLAIPLSSDEAPKLAPIVAHGMAHAAFWSPRAWLNEGVANFAGTLWIEAADGRTAALENLNSEGPALAIAEPAPPGDGPGEPLVDAKSAIFYRTKATYVFWMLRNMVGDTALQEALQAYDPAQDTTPEYFEKLLEKASGKDLDWFFQNWVNQDKGLPDLSIAGVFTSPEAHQQFMVAVDIANSGYAEAMVPVTVKGADTSVTEMVRVPAQGKITHHVIFQEKPIEVDMNDGTVPEVEDSVHVKTLVTVPAAQ